MKTKSIRKPAISKNSENSKNTYSTIAAPVKTSLFGLGITNATTEEILEYLFNSIKNSGKNVYVVTPNPEMVVLSHHSQDFKLAINSADIAMCDGAGLFKAAQLVGKPLQERIIGTNFVEKVCEKVEDWPITVGFLGGKPGVAEKVAERLAGRYPKLKISFVGHEWPGEEVNLKEDTKILRYKDTKKQKSPNISISQYPNILFVAFGAPKQELWMAKHLNKIPVRVMIGVGGAFDQIANPTLRPPQLVHQLGLGWLYRLIHEPWRIKRQTKLLEFIRIVLKEKFS